MEIKEIEKALEREIKAHLGEYFSYAWRDKLGEMLAVESKFARLLEWVNKEIADCCFVVNFFSPADKNENYTRAKAQIYVEHIKRLGILVHCRELLIDSRTTVEMRENIEYTLCKFFNIFYEEKLDCYIYGGKKNEKTYL